MRREGLLGVTIDKVRIFTYRRVTSEFETIQRGGAATQDASHEAQEELAANLGVGAHHRLNRCQRQPLILKNAANQVPIRGSDPAAAIPDQSGTEIAGYADDTGSSLFIDA